MKNNKQIKNELKNGVNPAFFIQQGIFSPFGLKKTTWVGKGKVRRKKKAVLIF
jgi:hypothetical protein